VEITPLDEIIIAALARADDVLKNHKVEVQCNEHLTTIGHSKAIAQVLFSLLENAGKYAPPGTTIRIVAGWDEFGDLRVAVEDEGPGVAPDLRNKIFEKFFRGDATDLRGNHRLPVTGLGLGLAIARRIADAEGGRIWVEERDDGKAGARFVVMLPAEPKEAAMDRPAEGVSAP
jgi:two-component system sensor histidine kinase KdpD